MSKKLKKHGSSDRLHYMHLIEEGYSFKYIRKHYKINETYLALLWARYQYEGVSGLERKQNVKADYVFKTKVIRDIEENDLTLVDAALKYKVSTSRIGVWLRIARTQGLNALSITKPRGRPLKNAMGRPKKKKPEEMTELERLRYENECLRAENALLKKVKALVEAKEARLKEIGQKPSKN